MLLCKIFHSLSSFLLQWGNASTHQGSAPRGWPRQKKKKRHLAFTGWQQQRHGAASVQPAGRTRLNPAGRGMCSETHWPGIWDVRLALLNDSLATMSIRATPSSLFDIKAKASAGAVNRRTEKQTGRRRERGGRMEEEAESQLSKSTPPPPPPPTSEWVSWFEKET